MPKLIQKSGFIKPGKAAGYIGYIATRDGVEKLPGPEGYVEYMAMRPDAERHNGHGLFSSQPVDLNAVMKEAERHTGPVWTLIYSLRRRMPRGWATITPQAGGCSSKPIRWSWPPP